MYDHNDENEKAFSVLEEECTDAGKATHPRISVRTTDAIGVAHDILAGHPEGSWIEHGVVKHPTPDNPGWQIIERCMVYMFGYTTPEALYSAPAAHWDEATEAAKNYVRGKRK